MDKKNLDPSAVVLDLVLQYTQKMTGRAGTAVVWPAADGQGATLLILSKNHQQKFVQLSVPVAFDGETKEGSESEPARWVLLRIAPGVWKLSQSVLSPMLHAYVTIVGVPEPAPWQPVPPGEWALAAPLWYRDASGSLVLWPSRQQAEEHLQQMRADGPAGTPYEEFMPVRYPSPLDAYLPMTIATIVRRLEWASDKLTGAKPKVAEARQLVDAVATDLRDGLVLGGQDVKRGEST